MQRYFLYLALTVVVSFIELTTTTAQTPCDCPYPVLFVHGWISSDYYWAPTFDDADFQKVWGDLKPASPNSDFSPHVFYVMPNAEDTHEYFLGIITNRNDDINGSDGVWNDDGRNDDVQWIFDNHDNKLAAGCLYAINFNNRKSGGDIVPNTALSSAPCLSCSDNNEAGIYKQGYAVSKMIDSVLAANPTKEKVILVGHSMGGLASREYLQRTNPDGTPKWWIDPSSPDGHKVAKLVTVGTPHLGSNTAGNISDLFTTIPVEEQQKVQNVLPDLFSEAVRDLRYSYANIIADDYPGPYLFGGLENDIPDGVTPYHSDDVNCDGDMDDIVIGINVDGTTPEGGNHNYAWYGTYDNPAMPLPTNVRYTWYCSDIISGGGGDGVVDDKRMWLFQGGDGTTSDFEAGISIPVPQDGIPHRLTDRITSPNNPSHTDEQGDVDHVVRAMDEGDYPAFAWDIYMNNTYAGMAQLPPDQVPADGNRTNGEDKDWFVFEVSATTAGAKILVTPTPLRAGRIDFFFDPSDYETGNSAYFVEFLANANPSEIELVIPECLEPEHDYYLRITHNQVAVDDWKSPFKFRVEPAGVMVEAKALLEGAYIGDNLMNTKLSDLGVLPDDEPYEALSYSLVGSGSESLNLDIEGVVDWMFLEIRDGSTPASILATKSVVLLSNGEIVDAETGCPPIFGELSSGNYYVALRHRNHLSVMTNHPIFLRGTAGNLIDFTDSATSIYTTTTRKDNNGTMLLIAGDADNDGSITAADRSLTWNNRNQSGYLSSDVIMNGSVGADDRSITWNNRNNSSALP